MALPPNNLYSVSTGQLVSWGIAPRRFGVVVALETHGATGLTYARVLEEQTGEHWQIPIANLHASVPDTNPHVDGNDIAHIADCAECQEWLLEVRHSKWVNALGMEGLCPKCGEASGFHTDDGECDAPDTIDEDQSPAALTCADHFHCAIDSVTGEHVDTHTLARRAVRFKVLWQKGGGHYHCRFFTRIEPSVTWQLCGQLVLGEAEWPAFKMGDFSLEPEVNPGGD